MLCVNSSLPIHRCICVTKILYRYYREYIYNIVMHIMNANNYSVCVIRPVLNISDMQ